MMTRSWLILILALALAPIAYAEGPVYDSSELDLDEIFIENATMITGRIRSIDLSDRSAIISGFEYHLGSSGGTDRCIVKMLGLDFGSVELLQANMFVEVYYLQESGRRLAKLIIQTDDGEEF
jgi:hypothetical protein